MVRRFQSTSYAPLAMLEQPHDYIPLVLVAMAQSVLEFAVFPWAIVKSTIGTRQRRRGRDIAHGLHPSPTLPSLPPPSSVLNLSLSLSLSFSSHAVNDISKHSRTTQSYTCKQTTVTPTFFACARCLR
jgi:hypothetical protein